MKARLLHAAVWVVSAATFRLASSSDGERSHTVTFDSAESPAACSCTCEAGAHGRACWAMARALDVLTLLCVNRVYVGLQTQAQAPTAELTGRPPLQAVIAEDGEMALLTRSATPLAGMVLGLP